MNLILTKECYVKHSKEKARIYTCRIINCCRHHWHLVAVSIPIFSSQLKKARIATDEANLRSYFAVLQADYQATGEYNYDPSITDEMLVRDTIKYKDGTTIKMKEGKFSVIRPYELNPAFSGYQIHYFTKDGSFSYTFGAKS